VRHRSRLVQRSRGGGEPKTGFRAWAPRTSSSAHRHGAGR
jgi:hypothetical protein